MFNKLVPLIIATCSIIFLSRCNQKNKKLLELEFVSLKDYNYNTASIEPGTEVELLAFSGGLKSDADNIYYCQFLVLNKATNDTIRILTPLICIDDEKGEITKTYTTPLQFDSGKNIRTAYYFPQDSSHNLALQTDRFIKEDKLDTTNLMTMMNEIKINQLVVVNKGMPELNSNTFKATIGILCFKEIPW